MAQKKNEKKVNPKLKVNLNAPTKEVKEVVEKSESITEEVKEVVDRSEPITEEVKEVSKLELTPEQLQEQINKGIQEALKVQKEEEAKKEALKAQKAKERADKAVESVEYEKFTELYFISQREGTILEPKVSEELKELGEKIKKRKGYMPKKSRTVFMGSGNGTVRIAKDYPVPKEIYDRFGGNADKWFL